MQQIEIKCSAASSLPLSQMTEFQGELKSLSDVNYEKLKTSILSKGFSFPLFIWKTADINYIIDGHQRFKTLKKLKEEGFEIPDIPVAYIEAESFTEAKKKLLAAASHFGKIEGQGLYEFITEAQIDYNEVIQTTHFADLDFKGWQLEFFKDMPEDVGSESGEGEDQSSKTCPSCGYKL
jgi:hypothetical protein